MADTRPANRHAAEKGLRRAAQGFSALGLSGHEILARELIACDALCAEGKGRVGAASEGGPG